MDRKYLLIFNLKTKKQKLLFNVKISKMYFWKGTCDVVGRQIDFVPAFTLLRLLCLQPLLRGDHNSRNIAHGVSLIRCKIR